MLLGAMDRTHLEVVLHSPVPVPGDHYAPKYAGEVCLSVTWERALAVPCSPPGWERLSCAKKFSGCVSAFDTGYVLASPASCGVELGSKRVLSGEG